MKNKQNIILIIILIVTVLFFIFEEITKIKFGTDYLLQIAGSLNILDGAGYTLISNETDCNNLTFQFFNRSPIGYSLISLPYLLFSNNFYYLNIFILMFSYSIIGFSTFKIGKELFSKNTYTLLLVVLVLSFSLKGHVVDLLTIAFFLSSIYYFSKSENSNKNRIIAIVFIIFTSIIRYAYYPQIIVFPLSLLFLNFISEKKLITKNIIKSIIIITVLFGSYAIWLKFQSLDLNRLNKTLAGTHFNFQNIFHYRPVFLDYFIDTYKIHRLFGVKYVAYDRGFEILFLVRFILLTISTLIFIISHFYLYQIIKRTISTSKKYILSSLLVASILNILFIYFLSFYYQSVLEEYIWTWAMLPRYFIINFFTFSLILTYFIKENNNRISKFVFLILMFLVTINLLDKFRLSTRVYSLNQKKNIEIMYPNNNIIDLNKLYNKYIESRGKYCIVITKHNSEIINLKWLSVYSKLLNFPMQIEEDVNDLKIREEVGKGYIYIRKRN